MKNKQVIKGVVASKGFARGRVRIITYPKEVSTFLEGEVLVSEYTNPAFVKAMVKAAAIITNSGGITSHAAIIARELSIPCIVGTRNATQVLQTGDLVEVDAFNGAVYFKE